MLFEATEELVMENVAPIVNFFFTKHCSIKNLNLKLEDAIFFLHDRSRPEYERVDRQPTV